MTSHSFDLDPAERLTAGAVGEPGERVFFIQAAAGGQLVTLLAEKEQVQALATAVARLLTLLPDVEDEGPEVLDEDLELSEPLVPEWRTGAMALDFDEARDRFVFLFHETAPDRDDEEEEPAEPEEGASLRVTATRAQARALAVHAEEVCAAGRPRCRICGQPLEENHVCPALNGHREIST